jgi:hypothetical protein
MLYSALMLTSVLAMPQGEAGNALAPNSLDRDWNKIYGEISMVLRQHGFDQGDSYSRAKQIISDLADASDASDLSMLQSVSSQQASGTCKTAHTDFLTSLDVSSSALDAVEKAKADKIEARMWFKCQCNIDLTKCPSPPPSPPAPPPPSAPPPCPKTQGCDDSCNQGCDDHCNSDCDGDCDDSCDFFSKSCDGGCDGGCNGSCDGSCDDSCTAGCDEPDPSCAAHTATFLEEKHEAASWADRLHAAKAKTATLAAAKSKKLQDPMHRH